MPPQAPLIALSEMLSRLERALATSPADSTELIWVEARRGQESNGKRRRDSYEQQERTVLVRVRQSGRYGTHRTSGAEISDLESAVREALAQARLSQPSPQPLLPEGHDGPAAAPPELYDPELARMTPGRARELVQRLPDGGLPEGGQTVRLGWAEGRMVVANSRGLRRAAEATSAWASVTAGQGSAGGGAGMATTASRSLAGLGPATLLARARERMAPQAGLLDLPDGPLPPTPVVLSQEAAAALLEMLNLRALTSAAFHHGPPFLRESLGMPVFHGAISLRDDATDPRGLPFPFDLLGSAKRPLDLIDRGVFLTPARDERLARELERRPTPHLVAPDEAAPSHLFLLPGERPDADLLRGAEGGLWIGALDAVQGFDPGSLRFRAMARGVRRIEGGNLGAPLPDLLWEDNLQTLLAGLAGEAAAGTEPVTVPLGDGLFGGITSPILFLERVTGLKAPAV
ncbi:MAG TPA: metallopeptidase TldD-related protein [Thermoanaerobaculia bacterium]|nr:metallopeptidase TldD-related protein [Thermoanaerobaculia bacterium]